MDNTKKRYWETQLIDRADRGLVPRKYCGNKAFVVGNYLVQRQVYITNRMAEIVVWDIYKSTDLKTPILTFKTKKAANQWIEDKIQTKLDI